MAYAQNSTSGLGPVSNPKKQWVAWAKTHFFMMMYLREFPRVWLSLRNSKEAAVGVEPGS